MTQTNFKIKSRAIMINNKPELQYYITNSGVDERWRVIISNNPNINSTKSIEIVGFDPQSDHDWFTALDSLYSEEIQNLANVIKEYNLYDSLPDKFVMWLQIQ